jgi:hypothetical protein
MNFLEALNRIISVLSLPWLGGILGILGLVTGYIFYRKSIVRRQIAAYKKSLQVIGIDSGMPSDVKLTYKNVEVPRVTKSLIFLLNSGNSTVKGEDIVEDDSLRIVLPEGSKVLDVSVLKHTKEANKFTAKERKDFPNEVVCTFKYLDHGDGATIRILHTGGKDIKFKGEIIGIPEGVMDLGDPGVSPIMKTGMRILTLIGAVLYGLLVLKTIDAFVYDTAHELVLFLTSSIGIVFFFLIMLSQFLPPIYHLYRERKQRKFSKLLSIGEAEW